MKDLDFDIEEIFRWREEWKGKSKIVMFKYQPGKVSLILIFSYESLWILA